MTDPTPQTNGGLQLSSAHDVKIEGDAVGRDKVTHITNIALTVNDVTQGLQALNHLIPHNPAVRHELVGLRSQLEAISAQIRLLSHYKEMHDLLHRLEFECYKTLVNTAPRFPAEPQAGREIRRYRIKLEGVLADLRTTAQGAAAAMLEMSWIEPLLPLPARIDEALQSGLPEPLIEAIDTLKLELDIQPARLNYQLFGAASALRLGDLATAMRAVHGQLAGAGPATEFSLAVQAGADKLEVLNEALTQLVNDHNAWQDVEGRLRREEALARQDADAGRALSAFRKAWPQLKQRTDRLCQTRPPAAVARFIRLSQSLEAGYKDAAPGALYDLLFEFCEYASELFLQVDVDLRAMCGELRTVGERLAETLRRLE